LENEKDVSSIRNSVLTVSNLSTSFDSHQYLIRYKLYEYVNQYVQSSDIDTCKAIANGYHRFASNSKNHKYCEEIYISHYICKLLDHQNSAVYTPAVQAFRKLAVSLDNCNQLIYYHGLLYLLKLSHLDDVLIRREVASALRTVAMHDSHKNSIIDSQGLIDIYELMRSNDSETCIQSTAALANMTELISRQHDIVMSGAIRNLSFIHRSRYITFYEYL
jgi:hypothetical protein